MHLEDTERWWKVVYVTFRIQLSDAQVTSSAESLRRAIRKRSDRIGHGTSM
jgi:hypothetical protein